MDFGQTQVVFSQISSLVYDRKLSIALRDTYFLPFLKRKGENQLTWDDLLLIKMAENCGLHNMEAWRQCENLYARMLYDILDDEVIRQTNYKSHRNLVRIQEIMKQSVTIQMGNILKHNNTYIKSEVLKSVQDNNMYKRYPDILLRLMDVETETRQLIEDYNKVNFLSQRNMTQDEYFDSVQEVCFRELTSLTCKMVWNKNLTVIEKNGVAYVYPKQYLLLIHNKTCDLISILVLILSGTNTVYGPHVFPLYTQFLKELANLAFTYEDQFFNIVKVLEGLGIGETLSRVERWKNTEFLDSITLDLQKATGFNYYSSSMQRIFSQCSIDEIHEFICSSKLLGHPFVNMTAGAAKLNKRVQEKKDVDMAYVFMCINYWKKEYIASHLAKYGKWPPCVLTSNLVPKILEQAFIFQKSPDDPALIRKYGKLDIEDYSFVEITCNRKYDRLENVIPYLKDKTISLLREPIVKSYILKEEQVQSKWTETRLLLLYLLGFVQDNTHLEYLSKYEDARDLEILSNYLVIRIVPKEKELKTEFRGFGCKTYEDRMRSVGQEVNSAEFLDEYSSEQCMTISELSLIKKLDTFRRLSEIYKDHTVLYIVIDSSAWNNAFRSETVDLPMQETMDKLYGTSIFGKTHKAFENTLVYIPDNVETIWWEGQKGGIEGLNQDTWVIIYLNQIRVALHQFPYKYHVLCKGDDLRIAIILPNEVFDSSSLVTIKNNIVQEISAVAAKFGHTINLEESYGSARYFAFSKNASLDLCELPQTFRKIQKCYGANNAFINTLDDYIASTFSNAHSASKVCPSVLPCYMTGLWWMYYYLLNDINYAHLSNVHLSCLSLIPSTVGGFPIIFLHNMHSRAESDMLSAFLDVLNYVKHNYPEYYLIMKNFCNLTFPLPTSLIGLMMDPYSIPVPKPVLPSTLLRSMIAPALRVTTQSQSLQELLQFQKSALNTLLLDTLSLARPIRAKILATLYSASPEGLILELTRKFESGRSVLELLILRHGRRRAHKLISRVYRAEKLLQEWRSSTLQGQECFTPKIPFIEALTLCPAESASAIRKMAWGEEVYDITMPPMSHLIHFGIPIFCMHDAWARENHFVYTTVSRSRLIDHTPVIGYPRDHYKVGDLKPFLGYTTRAGTLIPEVKFSEKNVVLKKVKALIDLLSWSNTTIIENGKEIASNCYKIIEILINCYIECSANDLSPFVSPKRSGTSQHHTRSPGFKESIVPNTLSHLYTRTASESNTHVRYRTSGEHHKVNFLQCLCWGVWNTWLELEVKAVANPPPVLWGITTSCSYCNTPIDEPPIRFPDSLMIGLTLPRFAYTRLGEAAEAIMRADIQKYSEKIPNLLNVPDIPLEAAVVALLREYAYRYEMALKKTTTVRAFSSVSIDQLGPLLIHKPDDWRMSLSEIKRMPIPVVSTFLINYAYEYLSYTVGLTSQNQFTIFSFGRPAELFPWYGLIQLFSDGGILHKILIHISVAYKVSAGGCEFDIIGATKIIPEYAGLIIKEEPPVSIYILRDYTTDLITNYLSYVINRRRQHHLRRVLARPYYSPSNIRILLGSGDHQENLMRSLLYDIGCYLLYNTSNEYLLDLNSKITDQRLPTIVLQEIGSVDYEVLHQFLDDLLDHIDEHPHLKRLHQIVMIIRGHDLEHWNEVFYDCALDALDRLEESEENIIKTEVVYMSLPDAVTRIRSEPLQIADDFETQSGSVATSGQGMAELKLQYNRLKGVYKKLPSHLSDINLGNSPVIDMNQPPIYSAIRFDFVHKLFGSSNDSVTTAIRFVEFLQGGIASRSPLNKNVSTLCLSDGHGGFTSVFNQWCTNSFLWYHTIPETSGTSVYPSAVTPDKLDQNSNRLIYQYLNQGIFDVENGVVGQYYSDTGLSVNIMTCDIELAFDMDEDRINKIYREIMKIAAKVLLTGGILLLKLPLMRGRIKYSVMTFFHGLFETSTLWSPDNEAPFKRFYIIGISKKTILLDLDDSIITSKTYKIQCLTIFSEFYNSLVKGLRGLIAGDWLPIQSMLGSNENDLFLRYRPYILYMITRTFGLSIPEETLENQFLKQILEHPGVVALTDSVLDLEQYGHTLYIKIQKVEHDLTSSTDDTRTEIYRELVSYWGLASSIQGFISLMTHRSIHRSIYSKIDVQLIHDYFYGQWWKSLPEYLSGIYTLPSLGLTGNLREYIKRHYYTGVATGLLLISTCISKCNYKM